MINYVYLWASVIKACHMRLAHVTKSLIAMACHRSAQPRFRLALVLLLQLSVIVLIEFSASRYLINHARNCELHFFLKLSNYSTIEVRNRKQNPQIHIVLKIWNQTHLCCAMCWCGLSQETQWMITHHSSGKNTLTE